MVTGAIETLSRVYRLGRTVHCRLLLNSLKHQAMLLGSALVFLPEIQKWFETSDNPLLARVDEKYAGLRMVLDKAEWFVREGEIVPNLFINDQRSYSIAFTVGVDTGQPLVFVGAQQGGKYGIR
jgi:hypothetical protein